MNSAFLKNSIAFILFFQAGFFSVYAQEYNLTGTITDTLKRPLEYANVLALPQIYDESIAFSISNEKGNYKLTLLKEVPYIIEIRYLGYLQLNDTVTLTKNLEKNYSLTSSNETLEEVILKKKLAIKVRKDTITYRTDIFTTGEERKLREVLKKLPGVEVDRLGNVFVNGKKVNKLLVDGKPFFTGDTKLGINNIPADAIDEIVVLDKYNEIAFLKGLSDSDKMAMNIKLKEGKKNFVFGDLELGSGIEDKYLIHPSLFYYSPKTNVNLIGDVNNIGEKAFTFDDYVNFEGGFSKVIEDPNGYSNLLNNEFTKTLLNEDFIFGKNEFGALNISHNLTAKTSINAFSIVSFDKMESLTENTNTYFSDDQTSTFENRINTGTYSSVITLNKLTVKYIPTVDDDIRYEAVIKAGSSDGFENLLSLVNTESNFVNSLSKPTSLELLQNASYSKKFSTKHTSTLTANFNVFKSDNQIDWLFSEPIFNEIIPLEGDAPFNIEQQTESKNYKVDVGLKHYWVLNNFNHIYPIVGTSFSKQYYRTMDFQQLGAYINGFMDSGFDNDVSLGLSDSYFGFQYKTKLNDFIIKPGFVYHYYNLNVEQFDKPQSRILKGQLLPELLFKWDISNYEKFNVKYNLISQFTNASSYASRLQMKGFNSLYRGTKELGNALKHQVSIGYNKFNLQRGLFYNANALYSKNINSIRNATQLEGINQINTSIYTNLPENNLTLNGLFSKKIYRIKGTLLVGMATSNYSRIINTETTKYTSNSYNYTLKVETTFKNYPNLEAGLRQSFSTFSSANFNNNFKLTNPFILLEYGFLSDFIFKADYNFSRYMNIAANDHNDFEVGNASLFYNKEDSPWGFEIDINNIFDIKFKNQNSFDQFIISDTKTFIQPRIILFKIHYKL